MHIPVLMAGFIGGAIRGIFGFVKHQYSYKNVGFKAPYFFLMVFLSGIVGLVASYLITGNTINRIYKNLLALFAEPCYSLRS
ncbi:hypothetical protein B6D52_03385 [Candidatus Parcubacteria bacterium 4484_255]|nr:MAG: hypothetical protein B6D52_03385 [Candidatus Parcubacteria bacterium 4484_255]